MQPRVQGKLCKRSLKNLAGVADPEYSHFEVIDSLFLWMLPCRHTKLFSFFQKVNELLQNLLSVPLFTVILPWYSQWSITVYIYVIQMESKYVFLTRHECKSYLGWVSCLQHWEVWFWWKSCMVLVVLRTASLRWLELCSSNLTRLSI